MFCCALLYVHSSFANHLDGKERAGCFAWFVFLVSRDSYVAVPHGAMGLIHIRTMGGVGASLNLLKPSSKIFLLTIPGRCFFVWIIYVISVFFLLCFRALLFIDALSSLAGKELTSWLSFVMSNCEVVTFQLLSWVRRGA